MSISLPFTFADEEARAGDVEARALLTPQRATEQAAGFDLVAANPQPISLDPGVRALVPTGVALAIPPGYEGSIRSRSGLALRHGVTCLNSPGTIDADYRGELQVLLVNLGQAPFEVRRGMRIAQLVISPVLAPALRVVEELPATARGLGGFGSTGVETPLSNPYEV